MGSNLKRFEVEYVKVVCSNPQTSKRRRRNITFYNECSIPTLLNDPYSIFSFSVASQE